MPRKASSAAEGPVRIVKAVRGYRVGDVFEALGSLRAWLLENGYAVPVRRR